MICCLNPECEQTVIYPEDCESCQQCGRPLKKRLRNRYKVIKPIGRGGFGITYLAKDNDKLNEYCVVKQLVLQCHGTKTSKKSRQLFEQEAIQLQRLGEYPLIPSLLAYFEEDDYLYLVQQFIPGRNLLEILEQQGEFNEEQIRGLLLAILPTIQFIHSHGVIHRDIKPQNIMCRDEDFAYILIDFGVSKTLSSTLIARSGTSLGSYGYSPPEQILEGKADPASDLFSLGACCFHLVSGVNPYKLWLEHGYSWVSSWQEFIKITLSPEMVYILGKLLSKESTQRYQDVAEVLADLHCDKKRLLPLPLRRESSNPLIKLKTLALAPKNLSVLSRARRGLFTRSHWQQFSIFAGVGIGLFFLGQTTFNFLTDIERKKLLTEEIEPAQEKKPIVPQKPLKFAQVPDIPSGIFSYGGSTTWASIRQKVGPVIQAIWPDYRLRYINPVLGNPGSGTGIKMLLEDQLSFSQSSRPLKIQEHEMAKIKGYTLREIAVAIDGIAIAIHPTLNIPGLTITQLRDIYRGKITNWQQIGGPNLAIVPYSRDPKEGGTVEFFIENVLGGEEFGSNVVPIADTTSGIKELSANPGGIYYASAIQVVSQCTIKPIPIGRQPDRLISPYQEPFIELSRCPSHRNQLNKLALRSGEYPITRRLFVIVKQDGRADETAGKAYASLMLTAQGQRLIEEAGFISLYGDRD